MTGLSDPFVHFGTCPFFGIVSKFRVGRISLIRFESSTKPDR
jgi:hypothetical protein